MNSLHNLLNAAAAGCTLQEAKELSLNLLGLFRSNSHFQLLPVCNREWHLVCKEKAGQQIPPYCLTTFDLTRAVTDAFMITVSPVLDHGRLSATVATTPTSDGLCVMSSDTCTHNERVQVIEYLEGESDDVFFGKLHSVAQAQHRIILEKGGISSAAAGGLVQNFWP